MRYLTEGGIEQLDGDHIPDRSYISGANYFERESQIMHFVSTTNSFFLVVILFGCCILSLDCERQ